MLLANNTEFGKSPNLDVAAFAELGYRMVLFPVTAYRSALKAALETLTAIRNQGHQRDRLPSMLTRAELYVLNLRHIQHHAAQLSLRLRVDADAATPWISSGRP